MFSLSASVKTAFTIFCHKSRKGRPWSAMEYRMI